MSRIGKKPVQLPAGVKVEVKDNLVTVSSADGKKKLCQEFNHVTVTVGPKEVVVVRNAETREARAAHGLYRSLIQNMVTGVSAGYAKTLDIEGAGYKVELKGQTLVLTVGYTFPREFKVPAGINLETPSANRIVVSGIDKQLVGQTAATLRGIRPADPYRGKGIRFMGEKVITKVAKGKGKK